MSKIVQKLLRVYDEHPYTIKLKSRFLFYIYIVILIAIFLGGIITALANINNPFRDNEVNYAIITFLFVAEIILSVGVFLLFRGLYEFSAHLLVTVISILIWAIIFNDNTYNLARMDTIVYLVANLSLLPIIISRRPIFIFIYCAANILVLNIFLQIFQSELSIPDSSYISYLGDNSLAIIAIAFIAYNIYSINRQALDKSERDLQARKEIAAKLQDHKDNLEKIVEDQTEELKSSNESLISKNEIINAQNLELKKTLQDLKEAQEKLIQTEKMASVGLLTSG